MKQIQQTEQITFSAISIQDAIIMLPVINELEDKFVNAYKDWEANRNAEDGWKQKRATEAIQTAQTIFGQLEVLGKLGFVSQNPGKVQIWWENN